MPGANAAIPWQLFPGSTQTVSVPESYTSEVPLYQVPELISDEVLEKRGAKAAKAAFANVPVAAADQLAEAHAIISRYTHSFRKHDRPDAQFSRSNRGTLAQGFPYWQDRERFCFYRDAARWPGNHDHQLPHHELQVARFQGRHVAEIASRLFRQP